MGRFGEAQRAGSVPQFSAMAGVWVALDGWMVMTARGWPVPHRGWLVGGGGRLIERWRGEGEGEHACRLQERFWLETLESGSSLRAADPAR